METKDVLTTLGLAITFGFNLYNHYRTSELRRDTVRLDEFKRLRAAIDVACAELKNQRTTLRSLETSGSTPAKLRKQIGDCNKAATASFEALCDGLIELDRSKLVQGADWANCATDAWDDVVTAFDGTYVREKDTPAIKTAIRNVIAKFDALLAAVQARMDAAIK